MVEGDTLKFEASKQRENLYPPTLQMKRKLEGTTTMDTEPYVKRIRSLTFHNLDEGYRMEVICRECGVPQGSVKAVKMPNGTSWVWKYTYQDTDHKSIGELVYAILKSPTPTLPHGDLEMLANVSASQATHQEIEENEEGHATNIYTAFMVYMKKKQKTPPTTDGELVEIMRQFALDVWIQKGSLEELKSAYTTLKTLYVSEHFVEFLNRSP